jgi:hypothetical protein
MALYHHVIYFDTATEKWYVDPQTDAYFPDGEVWVETDEVQEWRPLEEYEEDAYSNAARDLYRYLNDNPHLEF